MGNSLSGSKFQLVSNKDLYLALFFFSYINEIVKRIDGSIRHFADDTSLYIIVDLPKEAARILDTCLFVCLVLNDASTIVGR